MKIWPLFRVVWLFMIIGVAAGAPTISGTDPEEIPLMESRQWVTIVGSHFGPDAVVTFTSDGVTYVIPPERMEFINQNKLRGLAGLFPWDVLWEVKVRNPDDVSSNAFVLTFEPSPEATDNASGSNQPRRLVNDGSDEAYRLFSAILGEDHDNFLVQVGTVQPKEELAYAPLVYDDGVVARVYLLDLIELRYCVWRYDSIWFNQRIGRADFEGQFFQTWFHYENEIYMRNHRVSFKPLRAYFGMRTRVYPGGPDNGGVIFVHITADNMCG